jgi:hypothetical protein
MKKAILSLMVFVIILMISNPSSEKHQLAACEKFQKEMVAQKRENEFSLLQVRHIVNSMNLTVRNYYLCVLV